MAPAASPARSMAPSTRPPRPPLRSIPNPPSRPRPPSRSMFSPPSRAPSMAPEIIFQIHMQFVSKKCVINNLHDEAAILKKVKMHQIAVSIK